ncbi:MAG: glycoside hydrolase family 28 protein [Clostridia bacterium]|nr:glycoside hydrolase family 28 protein [Clostridia bacterium]
MYITEFASYKRENDWTQAFKKAIEKLDAQGGGVLKVSAGVYYTAPIKLVSHMKLEIEAGAEIRFFDDLERFDVIDLEFEGILGKSYMPCLYAENAEFITVCGEGTLNGQGTKWWKLIRARELKCNRPYLVCFNRCRHVTISGLTLTQSPVWTVHPLRCSDVAIKDLRIINPSDSPNTDGIDPDGCEDVTIDNCYIDVGDDCIAIKSGTEDTIAPTPSCRIIISNCHFLHGHGGVVLGSEMSGGIHDVVVSNCVFHETDRGIRLKTRRGRGGDVSGLRVNNLMMDGVMCAFVFNMFYFCGKNGKTPYISNKLPQEINAGTPSLSDVSITGVSIKNCTACAGYFYGLPERPVDNVTISDVSVSFTDAEPATPAMMADCPKMQRRGFYLRNAKRVNISGLQFSGLEGPEFDTDE